MASRKCDLLIVGGGTGGVAAALAAASHGLDVVLTEETDWVGGQFTAQAVPPDEHPWIEQCGCTARYRAFRDSMRTAYRRLPGLREPYRNAPLLNPGGGWVSRLCVEPTIAHAALAEAVSRFANLDVRHRHKARRAFVEGERILAVEVRDLATGDLSTFEASWVIDATELGDLIAMSGTEYVLGAESVSETGEPNAVVGPPQPNNVQGLTWVYALALAETPQSVIAKPDCYDRWASFKPDFWPGPLLGFEVLHAHTGEPRTLPLFRDDGWYALFPYRQIVEPAKWHDPERRRPVTIVNWPQNDYFLESVIDVDNEPVWDWDHPGAVGPVSQARLEDARELGKCLLYWLQTDAPRHDGGAGYPELCLAPEVVGTADGFAKYPYIRESRRIRARFTVLEQHVAAYENPGRDRAAHFEDSVGIGAYRIDLHPSTSGANTIDTSTLPFQIPFGAMVPVRMRNLLPGCKNLGVTHITNGCCRLHPVEWNIGEAAGLCAAFCQSQRSEPHAILDDPSLLADYRKLLEGDGIATAWPGLYPL